jgi:hypothetical protein
MLAPVWQNTYYLEHTGLFRVSLGPLGLPVRAEVPQYAYSLRRFRILQSAGGSERLCPEIMADTWVYLCSTRLIIRHFLVRLESDFRHPRYYAP